MHETYQKKSLRNRATILGANGKLVLSVPLKKGKTKKAINEVEISYDSAWQKQHLFAIKAAYSKAPYYEDYIDNINSLIGAKHRLLFDLNRAIHKWITACFHLNSTGFTETYTKEAELDQLDYRVKINLEMAPQFRYHQVFDYKFDFVDGLSILDLIFNLGPETELVLRK